LCPLPILIAVTFRDRLIATIRAAVDGGVNLIDTADSYGSGRAEVLVSQAVAGRRDEVLIATKCGIAFQDPDLGIDLRAPYVKNALERSLTRLATDHVDLLQLHWPDGEPIEEGWQALVDLQLEGKTRWIGVSNFSVDQLRALGRIRRVDSLQNQCSMLWREDEADVLPYCASEQIGYMAYGPLAYGMLSGKYHHSAELSDWRAGEGEYADWDEYRRLFAPGSFERNVAIVDGLAPIAEELGVTLTQLALAWVLERPGLTCVIPGAKSPEQARLNAAAGDLELSPEALKRIGAILAA